jgi:phage gpG-like protein
VKIEFDVFGDVQLARQMLRFSERSADVSPAWEAFADVVEAIERRQFNSQGVTSSLGWAPLKPSTIAAKASAGLDPRILHATQRLRGSLTQRSHPDHVRQIAPHEAFVGTRVPYARFHQRGTRRMPRRRAVELTVMQRRNLVRILQLYLVRGEVRRIGLRGGGET